MSLRGAIALFALVSACGRSDSKPPEPVAQSAHDEPVQQAESPSPPRPGEAALLATLQRMGTRRCTSPDSSEWQDVHLRAGLIRLTGNVASLEPLRGKPVILFGSVAAKGRPVLPAPSEACPLAQSRSDWIDSPDGTVLRRDDGPGIAEFHVRAARPFESLTARQDGDSIALELANPLGKTLEATTLRVHYEGCYGKPLTHSETREIGKLAPSAARSATVSALASVTQGNRPDLLHVAHSVQVSGKADDVYFDLDVRLKELGVELSCPER